MVRSHAKNNTTQSTLTYYERTLLRRQNEARRVGQDSFKPLDHCNLCLSNIYDRSPVACAKGHVYCKECIISDLITQKAGIEASKRELERWEDNEVRERNEARQKARMRVVEDFEKGMGLGAKGALDIKALASGSGSGSSGKANGNGNGNGNGTGGEGRIEELTRKAEERALAKIQEEQIEARKSKLAAFWLPSLTPEAKLAPVKDMKLQTMCHVGGQQHPISRKTILPVIFTYPPGAKTATTIPGQNGPKPICPSCSKDLSNSNQSVLLSSRSPATSTATTAATATATNGNGGGDDDDALDGDRPKKKSKKTKDKEEPFVCGHVICKTCSDVIVKESGRCCVCEATILEGERGMIPLGKEGTGFAAAGGSEVKGNVTTFRV